MVREDLGLLVPQSFLRLRGPAFTRDDLTLFKGMIFARTAFLLENPHQQNDARAQYQADIEGAMRVNETLIKGRLKDRQPYLDGLIRRREAGTLHQFIEDRATESCKN